MENTRIYKALSDETRVKILECLIDGEKCVCEIVPRTGRTQSTVSIQLSKLENMGIVSSRREGKSVYYKITNNRVRSLVSDCCLKWFNLDRKKINWFPKIDEKKCDGCGLCLIGCEKDVFGFNHKKNKVFVMNSFNCRVGCRMCETYCIQNAISLPDEEYLKGIIRENNLTNWSRNQIEKGGEIE